MAFIGATDRKGGQLYPGAHMVARIDDAILVEWYSVVSDCEEPAVNRTWIDESTGRLTPGILGDAQHVERIAHREATERATNRSYYENVRKPRRNQKESP